MLKEKEKIEDVDIISRDIDVLMTESDYDKDGYVFDSFTSINICKKRDCFEGLKEDSVFGYTNVVNKESEDLRRKTYPFKFHDVVTKIFNKLC